MRVIPDILAARLGGATTLCHCWRLLLRDGARLGFTDHDQDLTFDGLTHAAASGLDASDAESSLGFGAAGAEVNGALIIDQEMAELHGDIAVALATKRLVPAPCCDDAFYVRFVRDVKRYVS